MACKANNVPKDWIIRGDFNMIEIQNDKSNDCGREISNQERFNWNELLMTFQIQDTFIHQGGPILSWTNGQVGRAQRLARLDRFYIPQNMGQDIRQTSYFIHGYSPPQRVLGIGKEELRRSSFEWNVLHLKGEVTYKPKSIWDMIPDEAPFFLNLDISLGSIDN